MSCVTETEEVTETETETEDITDSDKITVYVVPAITDNKILPKSSIPSSYLSNTISVKASPGEFEPASFVIRADQDINSMTIESTALTGSSGTIPSTNVDIRTVKCWYQGGYSDGRYWDVVVKGRYLTPELLLKDDSLIRVTGEDWTRWDSTNPKGKNELKLASGSYIDISSNTPQRGDVYSVPISQRPVSDATALQPVTLPNGYNKQFWVTLNIPNNANAGNYRGIITIKIGTETIKQIQLNLQVLPIVLSKPTLEYSIYYRGEITDQGSISSVEKTIAQFTAEQKNMLTHGVINPALFSGDVYGDSLGQILTIRNNVGLDNTNLYHFYLGINNVGVFPDFRDYAASYGVENYYVCAPDEQNINDPATRAKITAIHNAGGKVMVALSDTQADAVADILDLAMVSDNLLPALAAKYHSYGHKIYSYANPQVAPEYPRTFRLHYGLELWQNDYDGAMDYAYQHSMGDIWNDFDYDDGNKWRDLVFAYPTANGVIDTIQWEGFREGVDDVRYLATLQNTIKSAKSQGKDTSAAESWLANLKKSDLTTQDLDAVRLQMINYIISLQK